MTSTVESELLQVDLGPDIDDRKLIALVAHNNMKPSMMAFATKYLPFLKTVPIVTTGSTGASLE